METTEQIELSEASKAMFRSAAIWMRTFAILMIIFIAIIAIVLLIISADRDGEFLKTLNKGSDDRVLQLILDTFGLILFGAMVFVVLFGYAVTRLLSAANSFTAVSYHPTREQVVKAFRNLKLYWMFYVITMIIVSVLAIYFIVKVAAILLES